MLFLIGCGFLGARLYLHGLIWEETVIALGTIAAVVAVVLQELTSARAARREISEIRDGLAALRLDFGAMSNAFGYVEGELGKVAERLSAELAEAVERLAALEHKAMRAEIYADIRAEMSSDDEPEENDDED